MKENLSAVEGLSTKIFEYQSFGRPIICISKGDAAEYIKKTRSGIVVNQDDYEGCINAINYLYNNRESADEMGKNGYTYLKNNLTSELIGNKLYSIFSRYVN
jgi:glycosyltransferase involved in cell wall biosynthesis